jgi:hypothetical protein
MFVQHECHPAQCDLLSRAVFHLDEFRQDSGCSRRRAIAENRRSALPRGEMQRVRYGRSSCLRIRWKAA